MSSPRAAGRRGAKQADEGCEQQIHQASRGSDNRLDNGPQPHPTPHLCSPSFSVKHFSNTSIFDELDQHSSQEQGPCLLPGFRGDGVATPRPPGCLRGGFRWLRSALWLETPVVLLSGVYCWLRTGHPCPRLSSSKHPVSDVKEVSVSFDVLSTCSWWLAGPVVLGTALTS